MTQALSTNTFGPAKWIVSSTAWYGTHTTIGAALTSASSGDTIFVRPGTYTENLTLKAGVNIVAYEADAFTPNVTIVGKATATFAGTCSISGIQLKTNSDYLLSVTGSSATIVNLIGCYINCNNNTGINYSVSNTSALIFLIDCNGDIGTTGISLAASSSTGPLQILRCSITNTGASTTATTTSAANISINLSNINFPITTSSSGTTSINNSSVSTNTTNTTCVTHGGSGNANISQSTFSSGTAAAISISSSSTANIYNCTINSTNTNPITGAGTVSYEYLGFLNTGIGINTTTQNPKQQTVIQTFTSGGTYTPTSGMKYCIIECVGGGGAGGGGASAGAGNYSCGGGGGAGEYARGVFTAPTVGSSQTVTIGTAGTGSSGADGGGGGNTSVGSLITANGGSGGAHSAAGTSAVASGGAGGTGGTGGSFRSKGNAGGNAWCYVTPFILFNGFGASSVFGGSVNTSGGTATGYGAGGGGNGSLSSGSATTGGNGTAGIVVVTEFCY